jgi:hypothetical protein
MHAEACIINVTNKRRGKGRGFVMFRNEFLQIVWEKGRVDITELAKLLNTTEDLVEAEAGVCAAYGLIRMLDSLIMATPLTDVVQ